MLPGSSQVQKHHNYLLLLMTNVGTENGKMMITDYGKMVVGGIL